jgi:cell division protein FtsZ
MDGARGTLLAIAGPREMTLHEVSTAASIVADHSDGDANIIFGTIIDDTLGDAMRVTVIAAGFDRGPRPSPFSFGSTTSPTEGLGLGDADDEPEGTDDMDIPGFVQG